MTLIAQTEFDRLRGSSTGWAPLAKVAGKIETARSKRYIFEDGSRLTMYFDGSASCERAAADVIAFHEGWHKGWKTE